MSSLNDARQVLDFLQLRLPRQDWRNFTGTTCALSPDLCRFCQELNFFWTSALLRPLTRCAVPRQVCTKLFHKLRSMSERDRPLPGPLQNRMASSRCAPAAVWLICMRSSPHLSLVLLSSRYTSENGRGMLVAYFNLSL